MIHFKAALFLGCFLALGAFAEDCSRGEAFWCSGLKQAIKCNAFNHCKQTAWKNEILTEDNSETCLFCKVILEDVTKFLQANKTEKFIEKYLLAVCDFLPAYEASTNCKIMIKEGLPYILELLSEKVDPQVVCRFLGLCNSQVTADHKDDHYFVGGDENNNDVHYYKQGEKDENDICHECLNFTTKVKDTLLSAETEKKVIDFIENKICKLLLIGSHECKVLTEKYVPVAFDVLRKSYDPEKICAIFCNKFGHFTQEHGLLQKAMMIYRKSLGFSFKCSACKYIIKETITVLNDNETQVAIDNLIKHHICPAMGKFNASCVEVVDAFGYKVWSFIDAEVDPAEICHAIKACPNKVELHYVIEMENPEVTPVPALLGAEESKDVEFFIKSWECTFCKFIVGRVEEKIGGNRTEEKIRHALDSTCDKLRFGKKACRKFVDVIIINFLDIFLVKVSPEKMCQVMSMCPLIPIMTEPKSFNTAKCQVCEIVAQYLEALIDQNATVFEIEHLVSKVCVFLPGHFKSECDYLIEEYGALVVHLIATYAKPHEICAFLNLCEEVKSVEKQYYKCIAGPTYWCASSENAKLCQAEEHCHKYVWI